MRNVSTDVPRFQGGPMARRESKVQRKAAQLACKSNRAQYSPEQDNFTNLHSQTQISKEPRLQELSGKLGLKTSNTTTRGLMEDLQAFARANGLSTVSKQDLTESLLWQNGKECSGKEAQQTGLQTREYMGHMVSEKNYLSATGNKQDKSYIFSALLGSTIDFWQDPDHLQKLIQSSLPDQQLIH